MSSYRIQFQKGMSEPHFDELYGTEDKCWATLVELRWPNGFECPDCGKRKYCIVGPRKLFQCARCRSQTSVTAGTIFASTKLPLKTWFRAMYHLSQSKGGISSIELARRLGVSQTTAWKISHKFMQVMLERENKKPLHGRVEMDDAYLGGKRSGKKRGRGASGKTPFVAAVETTDDRRPIRMKLYRVRSFCKNEIKRFSERLLSKDVIAVTDGLPCFTGVMEGGCKHEPHVTTGNKHVQNSTFKWVNTSLGNIKGSLLATYKKISPKHVPRYLASFAYRYNRRFDLASIMIRLPWVALRTPPMPYRLLKLAEDCG